MRVTGHVSQTIKSTNQTAPAEARESSRLRTQHDRLQTENTHLKEGAITAANQLAEMQQHRQAAREEQARLVAKNAEQLTELKVLKKEVEVKDEVSTTHISFKSLGKLRSLNLLATSAPAESRTALTHAEVQAWDCARVKTFMQDEIKVRNALVFLENMVDGKTLLECTSDDLTAAPFLLLEVKARMVLKALASARA